MPYYDTIKALHIIFIVTWFAGLFYIVRLFIYHAEANLEASPKREILVEQYQLMTKRLWFIITWPSAIITLVLAVMLLSTPAGMVWLKQPWMHVKLLFVVLLYIYHGLSHILYRQVQSNHLKYTSNQLRFWNEAPTLILFSVVFLVVLKSAVNWIFGVVGIMGLMILLMVGIKTYKKMRTKNSTQV